MKYLIIASGVVLAMGIGLACLIKRLRGAFTRDKQTESDPILLFDPRPRQE